MGCGCRRGAGIVGCACAVEAGANIGISGSGTDADPWVISSSGEISDTQVQVSDTASLDLSISGDGSVGNPYIISGTVLRGFVSVLDTASLNLTLTGTGTQADPYVISGVVTPTSLAVTDTSTLNLTLTGTGTAGDPYTLSGVVTPTPVAVTDSDSLNLSISGDGTPGNPWTVTGNVIVDPAAGNLLSSSASGLLAAPGVVTVSDTATLDLSISGAGTAGSPYVVSGAVTSVAGMVTATADAPDGIGEVTRTGSGTVADPYVLGAGEVRLRHLYGYGIPKASAGGSTTIDTGGITALAATGTATGKALAATNKYTRARLIEYLVTVAATTAVAGVRHTDGPLIHRGASAGVGGFYHKHVWAPATGVATATHRAFCGLTVATAAPTDVDPSTLVDMIGMGWDDDDTNVQIMHNDGAGAATKVDTGWAVPTVDRTSLYSIEIWCTPNESKLNYRARDLANGLTVAGDTGVSANIPAAASLLIPRGWVSVGGTSSVVGYAWGGWVFWTPEAFG